MSLTPIIQLAILYACIISFMSLAFTMTFKISGFANLSLYTLTGVGVTTSFLLKEIIGLNLYFGLIIVLLVGGVINSLLYLPLFQKIKNYSKNMFTLSLSSLVLTLLVSYSLSLFTQFLRREIESSMWSPLKPVRNSLFPQLYIRFSGFETEVFGIRTSTITSILILIIILVNNFSNIFKNRLTLEEMNEQTVWFLIGGLVAISGTLLTAQIAYYPGFTHYEIIITMISGSILAGLNSTIFSIIGGLIIGFFEIMLIYYGQAIIGIWIGEYRIVYIVLIFLTISYIKFKDIIYLNKSL